MSRKLYVGNLSFQTSKKELEELFSQAGTVESASVIEDRDTGRSRGFAFVEMSTNEEADEAIARFNGTEIDGRTLRLNAREPSKNRRRGRYSEPGAFSWDQSKPDENLASSKTPVPKRLHIKGGDQECVIEIEIDDKGQPIDGHVVIFSAAEEKQVAGYFEEIENSRQRSSETLKEIDAIKKKTQAILNGLS